MTEPVDEHQQQCLLCDEPLAAGSTQVVQNKAVKRFVKASQRRKDNRYVQLKKHDTLTVHVNCTKTYCREADIQRARRKLLRKSLSSGDFDFKGCCLICGKDASDELIRSLTEESGEQPAITRVSDAELKQDILERIDESSDEKNLTIAWRLNSVESLIQKQARYHDNCLVKLYKKNPELDVNDRVARFCANHIDKHPVEHRFDLNSIVKDCEYKDFDLDVVAKRLKTGRMKNKIRMFEDNRRFMRMTLFRGLLKELFELQQRERRQKEKAKLEGYDAEKQKMVAEVAAILRQFMKDHGTPAAGVKGPPAEGKRKYQLLGKVGKMIREAILAKANSAPKLAPGGDVLEQAEEDMPEMLRDLLEKMLHDPKEPVTEDTRLKIINMCHTMIGIVCDDESDYVSPLQEATATMIYKESGSMELVKEMSELGICTPHVNKDRVLPERFWKIVNDK